MRSFPFAPHLRRAVPVAGAVLLATLCARPAAAGLELAEEPERGGGPLRLTDRFVAGLGSLTLDPTSAVPLSEGHWQGEIVAFLANTWALSGPVQAQLESRSERGAFREDDLAALPPGNGGRGGDFLIDGEIVGLAMRARRGLRHHFELELELPVYGVNHDSLDGLIESFHDALGFAPVGRPGLYRHRFQVLVAPTEGTLVSRDAAPGVGLGDLQLRLKRGVRRRQHGWNVAVEAALKLPTGNRDAFYGSGSVDVGAQGLASRCWSRLCGHGGLGIVYNGRYQGLDAAATLGYSGGASLEVGLARWTTGIFQLVYRESPLEGLGMRRLAQGALLASLGLKFPMTRSLVHVSLTENYGNFNSSADLALHVGYVRNF